MPDQQLSPRESGTTKPAEQASAAGSRRRRTVDHDGFLCRPTSPETTCDHSGSDKLSGSGKIHRDRPYARSASRSHFGLRNVSVVQYSRSFEHLEAYARNANAAHLPAWRAFNEAVGSNGDVGIWHKTHLISPGKYEGVYNMPAFKLGAPEKLVDAVGRRKEAKQGLRATASAVSS